MNKQEFLRTIALKMHGLPQNDINQSIDYYEEMIDDRIEEARIALLQQSVKTLVYSFGFSSLVTNL